MSTQGRPETVDTFSQFKDANVLPSSETLHNIRESAISREKESH